MPHVGAIVRKGTKLRPHSLEDGISGAPKIFVESYLEPVEDFSRESTS